MPQTIELTASYVRPAIFSLFPELVGAESTRHGGVSPEPFSSLNLGINTADDIANVDENRRRFLSAIGAEEFGFTSSYQVHGLEILLATEAGRYEGYDALVTNQPGLLVGVTVADCVPILVYDSEKRVVAAVHAGWKGTTGKLVAKTISLMKDLFGTNPEACYAYIGTCIDECSFEVGPEVADLFEPAFRRAQLGTVKSYVDLKAANRQLLLNAGVPAAHIEVSSYSTVLNNDSFFSHRAEHGQTGRMLAVIGVKK
ncbi:peptidoglycan editing factor PgeF [Spirosoma sp. KUDC1026]|uniref:peptidoglycan editing factor PgeF n=1 Tax=Spirosoma sp. KUDC1026 TaxID=2745947 RepID=UPI00159B8DC5|nr:peptidoglycan editing factor PgeF [Spirosoma sp. KUDC1026]QKZ15315.1 peptidoglycan editing factor PgeF [Spirosoma sp. KUDC1026]